MNFEIIDGIKEIETIAQGSGIRDLTRLKKFYGLGNWKKMKGIAHILLSSGKVKLVELHWYEAHGIGKKEIKRKRYLE
ncbi:MAG: hypothetical protein JW882_11190 [Deltaproteobacteria bacterium]|nr:hypothetical protein [Deltaproteobacteria bacterium]